MRRKHLTVMALAAALVLAGPALADEILYFKNGTTMFVPEFWIPPVVTTGGV